VIIFSEVKHRAIQKATQREKHPFFIQQKCVCKIKMPR